MLFRRLVLDGSSAGSTSSGSSALASLIGTAPDQEMVATFVEHGGSIKPKLGQLTVCWAPDERSALDTAMRWWPTAAVKGS
jgi:hypothetical protein